MCGAQQLPDMLNLFLVLSDTGVISRNFLDLFQQLNFLFLQLLHQLSPEIEFRSHSLYCSLTLGESIH